MRWSYQQLLSVYILGYSLFLYVTEVHCFQQSIKNKSSSHTLDNMFLHYREKNPPCGLLTPQFPAVLKKIDIFSRNKWVWGAMKSRGTDSLGKWESIERRTNTLLGFFNSICWQKLETQNNTRRIL